MKWVLRLAIAFGAVGAFIGVFLMFGKVPPIAESGHKPDDVLWYAFWIPLLGIFGSIAGAAVGLVLSAFKAFIDWATG